MGHRSFPHSHLEPLQITHNPLVDDRAVIVGTASSPIPVPLSTACSHVFEYGLGLCVWENVNLLSFRMGVSGFIMFSEERLFYITKV